MLVVVDRLVHELGNDVRSSEFGLLIAQRAFWERTWHSVPTGLVGSFEAVWTRQSDRGGPVGMYDSRSWFHARGTVAAAFRPEQNDCLHMTFYRVRTKGKIARRCLVCGQTKRLWREERMC